jgi:hypothetical protein
VSAWLAPLREALDAAPAPVTFFFRDDDAGWRDDRLEALLDVFSPSASTSTATPTSTTRPRGASASSAPTGPTTSRSRTSPPASASCAR